MNQIAMEILDSLANNLRELGKTGVITGEHLESTDRNRLNETHSLVWGALFHSVYLAVGRKCAVSIGRGLKLETMKKRFVPDISIWTLGSISKLVGVVDYESTNSSDSRIVRRDFANYRQYVQTPHSNVPEFWIIVTSLPSRRVSKSSWYSWDLRRKRISRDEYLKLLENPFEYWFPKFSVGFDQLQKYFERCPLYVANLDFDGLRLCLPSDKTISA